MSSDEIQTNEAVGAAAEHAGEAVDMGSSILHHILDSHGFEIPFTHRVIPLPRLTIGPYDFSITKHVVMMWLVGIVLFVVLRAAARRAHEPVPRGVRGLLEPVVAYIRDDVARRAIGDQADRYLPYLLTTFFFILTANLLGLVPGLATATGNISVTAGLAFMAFLMIQWGGVRQYGLAGHARNLVPHGLPTWLVPLMIVIEFLSNLIRPFALCIRLFANMMAGHVVILAFISLVFILGVFAAPIAVGFALFVHVLELLVAFLQAYIFTMLTAQFIGLSVHPAH
jgi:F-type H+-transporting ATPase subunit a